MTALVSDPLAVTHCVEGAMYGWRVQKHDGFVLRKAIAGDTVCQRHMGYWPAWRRSWAWLGRTADRIEWVWP